MLVPSGQGRYWAIYQVVRKCVGSNTHETGSVLSVIANRGISHRGWSDSGSQFSCVFSLSPFPSALWAWSSVALCCSGAGLREGSGTPQPPSGWVCFLASEGGLLRLGRGLGALWRAGLCTEHAGHNQCAHHRRTASGSRPSRTHSLRGTFQCRRASSSLTCIISFQLRITAAHVLGLQPGACGENHSPTSRLLDAGFGAQSLEPETCR